MPQLADLNTRNAGRVYVLLLDSGEFKVGKSFNFRTRLGQLRGEIRRFQKAEVVDGWYSNEHETYHATEVRLMAFCLERFGSPTYGAEVFAGDFRAVIAYAEQITTEATCTNCTGVDPAPALAGQVIEGASV